MERDNERYRREIEWRQRGEKEGKRQGSITKGQKTETKDLEIVGGKEVERQEGIYRGETMVSDRAEK
jgi:hypothetical protein